MVQYGRFYDDYDSAVIITAPVSSEKSEDTGCNMGEDSKQPAIIEQLSKTFNAEFFALDNSSIMYSQVKISDGETEQTYLVLVDANNQAAEYPIKVYPLVPNAKDLFGYKQTADEWRCGVFCITNDIEHVGEVMILTPHMKRIEKRLRDNGELPDSEVKEFVQEVADWTLRTTILRKAIIERKKRSEPRSKRPFEYTSEECPRCKRVVISSRAYLSINAEAASRDPLETGGVLLGQYDSDGTWYVVEATDPGLDTYHSTVHNEMDDRYYNHLYPVLSRLYKHDLYLVGLWHRHPGAMDHFSSDDNRTNSKFAEAINNGTLSFLLNVDHKERLTCYYLDDKGTGEYHRLPVYIGDKYFKHTEYLDLASSTSVWKEKERLQEEINCS